MAAAWAASPFARNAFNCQYSRFWDCNDADTPPFEEMEEERLDSYIPDLEDMPLRRCTAINPGVVWGDDYDKPYPQANKVIYLDHNWKEVTNPTPEQLEKVYDRRVAEARRQRRLELAGGGDPSPSPSPSTGATDEAPPASRTDLGPGPLSTQPIESSAPPRPAHALDTPPAPSPVPGCGTRCNIM
jgi:hypothetical protein